MQAEKDVNKIWRQGKDEYSSKTNNVSLFTKELNAEVPVLGKKIEVNLPNINITEEMVQNEILKLNVNKSCRPDEIELVDLASKHLALLLNKTMDRTGKWYTFYQYLRKGLEIKQITIDP